MPEQTSQSPNRTQDASGQRFREEIRDWRIGRRVQRKARELGMNALRAEILADVASWRDGWEFRHHLAARYRCHTRTVQRALNQSAELGLLEIRRAKPGEIPPGARNPLPCGWSHRWVPGRELIRGKAPDPEAWARCVNKARLARLVRRSMGERQRRLIRRDVQRSLRDAQIDERRRVLKQQAAELMAQDAAKARDGPGSDS